MIRRSIAVAAVAALAALTGCGGGTPATATSSSVDGTTIAAASASPHTPPGTVANITNPASTVQVRDEPSPTGKIRIQLPGRTKEYKTPLVLPVTDMQPGWLYVTVPGRNGGTGWVQAGQFKLATVTATVRVDLSDRTITITVGGKTHTGPVAIGSAKYPTPTTGDRDAFVTDNLDLSQHPGGAYGSRALGISLWSKQLTQFGSGDGQIGIHGTNDQASVGKPVSNGCVRVKKDFEPVLAQVPTGSTVTITQ
jgi:lipoprotein-anchoring transpeptidase ErfK/SrfK